EALTQLVDLQRDGGTGQRDHGAVVELVPTGVGGGELHVAVGDQGGCHDQRLGIGGNGELSVVGHLDPDPIPLGSDGGHFTDLDAEDADAVARVEPDGLGEVGGDVLAVRVLQRPPQTGR